MNTVGILVLSNLQFFKPLLQTFHFTYDELVCSRVFGIYVTIPIELWPHHRPPTVIVADWSITTGITVMDGSG